MGVHGLWELLSPVGHRVSNDHVRNKVVAVDVSIWLTQFVKAMRDAEGAQVRNGHLLGVFRRCVKLLFLSVRPVLIFDGEAPALKRRTLSSRRAQREKHVAKLRRLAEKMLVNHIKKGAVSRAIATRREDQRGPSMSQDNVEPAPDPKRAVRHEKEGDADKTATDDEEDKIEPAAESRKTSTHEKRSVSLKNEDYDMRSSLDSPENALSEDMEEGPITLPEDLNDIDDEALLGLPANIQSDVFKQIKLEQRARHRENMIQKQRDPAEFSKTQIEGFLRHTALNRKISNVRNATNFKTGASQRIASDSARIFVLEEAESFEDEDLAISNSDSENDYRSGNPVRTRRSNDLLSRIRERNKVSTVRSTVLDAPRDRETREDSERQSGVGWASQVLGGRGGLKLRGIESRGVLPQNENGDIASTYSDEERDDRNMYPVVDRLSNVPTHGSPPESAKKEPSKNGSDSDDIEWEDGGESPQYDFKDSGHVNQSKPDETGSAVDVGLQHTSKSLNGPNPDRSASLSRELYAGTSENDVNDDGQKPFDSMQSPEVSIGAIVPKQRAMLQDEGAPKTSVKPSVRSSGCLTGNRTESPRQARAVRNVELADLEKTRSSCKENALTSSAERGREESLSMRQREKERDDDQLVQVPTTSKLEGKASLDIRIRTSTDDEGAVCSEEDRDIQRAIQISLADEAEHEKDPCHKGKAVRRPDESIMELPLKRKRYANGLDADLHSTDECPSALERAQARETLPSHPRGTAAEGTCEAESKSWSLENEGSTHVANAKRGSPLSARPTAALEDMLMERSDRNSEEKQDASPIPVAGENPISIEAMERLYENLDFEAREIRRQQASHHGGVDSVSDEMYAETRDLLKLFGIPYLQAPTEAEAQCAFLNRTDVVDAVITEDSDAFLFGARTVYRHLFAEGRFAEAYEADDILSSLGLNRESLVRLAYLLGSDYTPGVRGVGVVNSMEILEAFPGAEGLGEFRKWTESVTVLDQEPGKEVFTGTSAEAVRRRFCWKHRNMKRNWEVREGFPNPAVFDAYMKPDVDQSTERFRWGPVDFEGLGNFCWEKFGWERERFENAVGPLRQQLKERSGAVQRRIDEFFKPHRFAKIRSERLQKAVQGMAGDKGKELMASGEITARKRKASRMSYIPRDVSEEEEAELINAAEEAEVQALKRPKSASCDQD